MTFREISFGSAEYQQECALRQEILRKPLGLNLYDEDLEKERQQRHFGLFDADGSLVGCVVFLPLSSCEARIRQMAIAQQHQGHGHGRRMFMELEERLTAEGVTRFVLHARATAEGFYQKLGYTVVSREFLEVGIPHMQMEKVVSRSRCQRDFVMPLPLGGTYVRLPASANRCKRPTWAAAPAAKPVRL